MDGRIISLNFTKKTKPLTRNTKIYRTLPLRRLLAMFASKQNGLARPRLWEDTFENLLLTSLVDINGSTGNFSFANDLYAQCWTLESYSDALWRIYSADQKGIRIRTTVGKLLDSLSAPDAVHNPISCFIGKVEYLKESELKKFASKHFLNGIDTDGENVAETLLAKRKAFQHEKEVRLIYRSPTTTDNKDDIYLHGLDCHKTIDRILVHPQLAEMEAQVLIKGISAVTSFKGEISQSKLYRLPKGFKVVIGT